MAIVLGTTFGNAILDALFNQANLTAPTGIFLSLHTGAPGATGANEVTDGAYARQDVTAAFGAAASKALTSTSLVSFPAAATGFTPTHFGVWDHATLTTAIHFIGGDALAAGPAVGVGEVFQLPIGDIDFSI